MTPNKMHVYKTYRNTCDISLNINIFSISHRKLKVFLYMFSLFPVRICVCKLNCCRKVLLDLAYFFVKCSL